LLALDKDGTLVVVELKRDDSGKNVELQAIKYAAYCSTFTLNDVVTEYQEYRSKKGEKIDEEKARKIITDFIAKDDFEAISDRPRIILVSKEFRLKVTASVFWLRKFGLNIRCVKLTPYLIDENKIGFESTIIIPLPEAESYIIKAERKDNKEITLTRTQEDDLEFYRDMVKKIGQVLPMNFPDPKPWSYYQIQTGIPSVHFEWGFHGRPRSSFGAELHFEKGNKDFNTNAIEKLSHLKTKLEKATGETLIIQKNWGKKWGRIYVELQEGKPTDQLKTWGVKNMKAFIEILQPELDNLK
jgi:hypothetical protein